MSEDTSPKPLFDLDAVFEVDEYMYFYGDFLTDERADAEVASWTRLLELDSPMKILDVPCGFGRHANRLAALGHAVTGVDFMPGFLEIARMNQKSKEISHLLRAVAILGMVFGLATLVSGGSVLFGPEEARVKAGAYIPWVVWFNFLAGFAYLAAGAGLWLARRWGAVLAAGIAAATLLALLGFLVQVAQGVPYEMRTLTALPFRAAVWAVIATLAWPRARR